MADEPSEVEALAHRMAWQYRKSSSLKESDTYTFNRYTLLMFAEALIAKEREKAAAAVREALPFCMQPAVDALKHLLPPGEWPNT